jgi:hypothetical protein
MAHAIVVQGAAISTGTDGGVLAGEAELLLTQSGGTFGCTGDLMLGGGFMATAAHCLTGDSGSSTTSSIGISFLNGTNLTASQYYVDPLWNGNITTGHDVAIIKLDVPVTSITGYAIDTSAVSSSTQVLMAGYGLSGVSGAETGAFGTLHYGYNNYDASSADYAGFGVSPSVLLYDFDSGKASSNVFGSKGLGASEAMIAPGDSGGGSFVDVGGTWELVGIHDFNACVTTGCAANSSFGTIGGDVSLQADMAWIDSVVSGQAATPEPSTLVLMLVGFVALFSAKMGRRFCFA